MLGDPVNFTDPLGLYIWLFFEPTTMGPNEIIHFDKNGNKFVYNFDSGKTRPYWEKKKRYCETKKDDGSRRYTEQDLIDADPNRRPPASRPKGNRIDIILELFERFSNFY